MKHETYDLRQMQSLPLSAKVSMTKRRIRDWYDGWDGQVYLSFSGGKDSTVLKHIIDDMGLGNDIPAVFTDTGLEYPEIRTFAKSKNNVIVLRPKMGFKDVITRYGYPIVSKEVSGDIEWIRATNDAERNNRRMDKFFGEGTYKDSPFNQAKWKFLFDAPFRISNACCRVMKKTPMGAYAKETGRYPMTAMMADESLRRMVSWKQYGCNGFDMKKPRSMPMAFWTEQDVLHYIVSNNVEYCSVYGDIKHKQKNQLSGQVDLLDSIGYEEGDKLYCTGCSRTGCIFCAYGAHLDKGETRFQRLKRTHPKHWEYCIKGGEFDESGLWVPNKDGLGMWKVLDFINVRYE